MTQFNKYNHCGSHKRAILHMIGQAVEVFKNAPTTAEIAAWMNVSKPTARKYLRKMLDNGEVVLHEEKHRPNVVKHKWSLDPFVEDHYKDGILVRDYQKYAQQVMKVILV